jgi:hypothetical protein
MTTPRQGQSGGRGTVHGDLSQMANQPRLNGVLYYGVLAVAAGIDIATFYQVLALVLRNVPDSVVWLGVIGFTVTALALAHTMGIRVRDRIDNGRRALGGASVWLLFFIWLFVGVTAFVVRYTAAPPSVSGGTTIIVDGQPVTPTTTNADRPLLAALLFLALYFATGTVAAVAGYLRHNTAARQYAASLKTRSEAARIAATSAADLALARQTLVALEEERGRREEGWVKAQEEWQAIGRRLKQETRLRLASAAQNPSVTDAYFDPPSALRRPVSGPGAAWDGGGVQADGYAVPAAPGAPLLPQQSGPSAPPSPYAGGSGPYGPATAGPYGPGPTVPYAGPPGYQQPLPTHPGQTAVPAVAEQPGPWRLNPAPAHRPAVDHGGTDRREAGR